MNYIKIFFEQKKSIRDQMFNEELIYEGCLINIIRKLEKDWLFVNLTCYLLLSFCRLGFGNV